MQMWRSEMRTELAHQHQEQSLRHQREAQRLSQPLDRRTGKLRAQSFLRICQRSLGTYVQVRQAGDQCVATIRE